MSNTKREPMLSEDQIELLNEKQYNKCFEEWDLTEDVSFHFTNGHLAGMREMELIYEAARAKDAELIQMLVDDLRLLRIEFGNRVGQTTEIGIASLSAAEADGFKPSDQ